jgi:leucyl-tRNA synthetase family protein
MHKRFDHTEIEKRWQEKWRTDGLYNVGERAATKEKEYVLVEWPYPSGNLHIGHWHAFAVPDIYVRYRRMNGVQVLFPMGFDAFGLPAENAAIKHGLNPREWTESNMAYMRKQLDSMGNAFSWDKTTASTDPEYYKWTQWMFGEFFKNDIAYRGEGIVNWCPGCHTVIANEQVQSDGTCDRCDNTVEKKKMPQWMIRITDFADELIDDIEPLNWPEHIKEAQKNWIGRSQGAEIDFQLSVEEAVTVFTTRPDTLFGATYLVLAPEHALVQKYKDNIQNLDEVELYIKTSKQKAEQDRLDATKEKTGVKLEGITATNPGSGEAIPVYIADYVLATYGTGAIMAVPAHDERDFAFAEKYDLPITQVVVPCAPDTNNPPQEGFDEVKRDTIIVHLKDLSSGKFAMLNWHGSLEGISTAIMGGIEEGQTAEEAVLAEIAEEAGLKNVRIIKKLRWITAAKYCASHKKQNRCAHTYTFIAEVENLETQETISDTEQKIHSLVWVEEQEVYDILTPDHQKLVWKLLQTKENSIAGNGYLINSGEFSGMDSEEARVAITEKVGGRMTNTYRLRDWSIGRQRYWGVPIPIVYDPVGKAHAGT